MKIIGAKVNWNNQWGNDSKITITVDKFKDPNYKYKQKGNLYFAYDSKTGLVSYYAYNPKDHEGYGGQIFELQMLNGKIKKLKGPWSSRSEVMNDAGFIPNTEITIEESESSLYSGAMTNDKITRVMKKFLPEIGYYIDFESKTVIIPKNQIANKELKKEKKASGTSLSGEQHKIVTS